MNLDVAALRAFIAAVELGGFGKAAQRLHRTPGAISLQMKALETRVGHPLFARTGRHQSLTPVGEVLLGHARRIVGANDDAVLALNGVSAAGEVRVGMPQDVADGWLAETLGRFARGYPAIRIDVRIARSAELRQALDMGALDLAVLFGGDENEESALSTKLGIRWWAAADWSPPPGIPLSLMLLDAPCTFRDTALSVLDKAGIPWRIGMASGGISAIWSAVKAGLGVTARTAIGVPPGVVALDGLPDLGETRLSVRRGHGAANLAADQLSGLIGDVIRARTLTP